MPRALGGWSHLLVDVDGTLLTSQGRITSRTREALARAVAAELTLVLASGRTYPSLLRAAGELQLPYHVIANGGAVGLAPGPGRGFSAPYVNALAAEAWPPIVEALQQEGLSVVVYGHRHPDPPLLHVAARQGDPHFESYISRHTLACRVLPDLAAAEIPEVLEVAALGRGAEFESASARVMQRFAGATRNHCMALYIQERYGRITEFFDARTSKWGAFRGLFPQARPERVIAVGDEANDLEMIAAAGYGVAMGNATPELRSVARHVTADNDHEGLALALEALLDGG